MRRFVTWLLVFALLLSGISINGGNAKAYTFGEEADERAIDVLKEELYGIISTGVNFSWGGDEHIYCLGNDNKINLSDACAKWDRAKMSYIKRTNTLGITSNIPTFPESLVIKENPKLVDASQSASPSATPNENSGKEYCIYAHDIVDSNNNSGVEELELELGRSYGVWAEDEKGSDKKPKELFTIHVVSTDLSVFKVTNGKAEIIPHNEDKIKDGVAIATNDSSGTYLFVMKSGVSSFIDTDAKACKCNSDLSVSIGDTTITIPKEKESGTIVVGNYKYTYFLCEIEDDGEYASYIDFDMNTELSGLTAEYQIIVDKTKPKVECFSFMDNIYVKYSDNVELDEIEAGYMSNDDSDLTKIMHLESEKSDDIVSGVGECVYHELVRKISEPKNCKITVTDWCGNKTEKYMSDIGYSYTKGSKHALSVGKPVRGEDGKTEVKNVSVIVPKVQAVSLSMYSSLMKSFSMSNDGTVHIGKGGELIDYDGNGNSKKYENGAYFKLVNSDKSFTEGTYISGSLWYVYEPSPVYGVESATAFSDTGTGVNYLRKVVGDSTEVKIPAQDENGKHDSFLDLIYDKSNICDVFLCKQNIADFIDPAEIGHAKEGYNFLPSDLNKQEKNKKYYFAVNKLEAPSDLDLGAIKNSTRKEDTKDGYVIYYIDSIGSDNSDIYYQTEYGYSSDYVFSFPLDSNRIKANELKEGFYGEGYLVADDLEKGSTIDIGEFGKFIIGDNTETGDGLSVYSYILDEDDKKVYTENDEIASRDKWVYSLRDNGDARQIVVNGTKYSVYNSSLVPNGEFYTGSVLANKGCTLSSNECVEPKMLKNANSVDEFVASLELPLIATNKSNIIIDSNIYDEDMVGNRTSSSFGWHDIEFLNIAEPSSTPSATSSPDEVEEEVKVENSEKYENVRLIPKGAFAWSNMYDIPADKVLAEGEDAENEVNVNDYIILADKDSEVESVVDMSTGFSSSLISEEAGSLLKVNSSEEDVKVKVTLKDKSWRVFNVKRDTSLDEPSGGGDDPTATPSPTPDGGEEGGNGNDKVETRRQYKIGEDGVKKNEVEVRVYDENSVVYDDTEKESVIEEESGEYTSYKKTVLLGDEVQEDQEYIRFEDFESILTEEDGVLKHEYSILPFTTVKNAVVYVNGKKAEDEGIAEELDPNDQNTELNADMLGRYVKIKGGKKDFDGNAQQEAHTIEVVGGSQDGAKRYFITPKGSNDITSNFVDLRETRYIVNVLNVRIPHDCYYVKVDGKIANTTNKGDTCGDGSTGKGEITGTIGRPTSVTPDNIEDGKTYPGSLIIGGIPDGDRVFVDGNEVFDRPVIIGSGTHEIVIVHKDGTVDKWTVTVDPSGGNGTTVIKPAEGTQNQGTTVNGIDDLIDGGKYPGDVTIIGIPDTWTVVVDGDVVNKRPVVITGNGTHVITVIDSNGNSITKEFTIEQNKDGSIVVPADKIQDGQIFDNGSIIIQPVGGKDVIVDSNGSGGTTVGGVDSIVDGGVYIGDVTITDIPDGWSVTVDGKPATGKPIVISGSGSHTIVATDGNGNTIIKNITLEDVGSNGIGGLKVDKDTEISAPGTHKVTITDESGNKKDVIFTVIKNGGDYSTNTVFDFSHASRVWVDGKEVNLKFNISDSGVHKIKVLYPDGTTAEFTVNIKGNTKKEEDQKKEDPKKDVIVTPVTLSGIFGVKNKKAYKKAITLRVLDKGKLGKATLKYKKTKKAKKWKTSTFTGSKVCKKQGMYKVIFGKQKVSFTIDTVKPSAKLKNKKSYRKGTKIKVKDNLSGVKSVKVGKKKVKVKKGKFTLTKKGKKIKVTILDKAGNKKKYTIRVK